MKTENIISSGILFIALLSLIYGYIYVIKPNFSLNKEKKFNPEKSLLISGIISGVITFFIFGISNRLLEDVQRRNSKFV